MTCIAISSRCRSPDDSGGAPREGASQEHYHAAIPPEAEQLAGNLTLRDGTVLHMRAIRPEDTDRLRAFHLSLSPDTIVFRFFRLVRELSREEAMRFTHVDYTDRMALLATLPGADDEPILAVVRYDRIGPRRAEVAFVVADRWQGQGIATGLLHRLAGYARQHGIETFVAITMGNNGRMLDVLRNAGFPCKLRYEQGDVIAELNITSPPQFAPRPRPTPLA